VLFAVAAVLVYLYVPTPLSPGKQDLKTTNHLSTSLNNSEELAIKEMLVEYVHAMLLEETNNYKNLFTSNFATNNDNRRTIMPKATSVQISQPIISITSPTDARVRFTQIIRTSNKSRHSQERLLLKRASTTGWRIDKRASQPIMNSISYMNGVSSDYNSFLYIKSETEKQQDIRIIKGLIQFWADARAEADIEGVVTTYRQDIWERKGINKEQWLEEFRNPKKVTITNVNVVFPGQNLAEVTLNEKIEDSNKQAYFDIQLMLQLSDIGWLISDENSKIVSEQILQPLVPPQLESIVRAKPIAEPKPIPKTEIVAKAEVTTTDKSTSNNTAKAVNTKSLKSLDPTAINNMVFQWKQAWASKDADAYLRYYSEKFAPNSGMSIEQWRRYRRIRLSKPKSIDIQIRDLQISQESAARADVTFTQTYQSNLFQDKIKKTLSLVKENNEWKIIGEKTTPPKQPSS
jgi:hypothetical protein